MLFTYTVYFGVLLLTMLIIHGYRYEVRIGSISLHERNKFDLVSLILVSIPFVLVLALRHNIGTDYVRYELYFEEYIKYDWISFEPLFELLMDITNYIQQDFKFFILLTAIVTVIPTFVFVLRSNCLHKGMMVFVLFSLLFPNWENIVRQSIAIAFCMLAFQNIEKRHPIKMLICTAIAIGFHYLSIVIVALWFFTRDSNQKKGEIDQFEKRLIKKMLSRSVFLVIIGVIGSLIILRLSSFLGMYSNYLDGTREGGVSIYFLLVSLGLVIPEFVFCKSVLDTNPNYEVYYYAAVLETLLFALGIFVPYGFRVANFFTPAHVILVPSVIGSQNGRNRFFIKIYYVFLLLFQFVILYLLWGYNGITPYTTIMG